MEKIDDLISPQLVKINSLVPEIKPPMPIHKPLKTHSVIIKKDIYQPIKEAIKEEEEEEEEEKEKEEMMMMMMENVKEDTPVLMTEDKIVDNKDVEEKIVKQEIVEEKNVEETEVNKQILEEKCVIEEKIIDNDEINNKIVTEEESVNEKIIEEDKINDERIILESNETVEVIEIDEKLVKEINNIEDKKMEEANKPVVKVEDNKPSGPVVQQKVNNGE